MCSLLNKPFYEMTSTDWESLRKSGVCNGWGPSSMPLARVVLGSIARCFPTIIADEHDRMYAKGGTTDDRRFADYAFLRALLRDTCRERSLWKRAVMLAVSTAYFLAVRAFGSLFFYKH